MLFAMNFECKITFKSKWKRFWVTYSLDNMKCNNMSVFLETWVNKKR